MYLGYDYSPETYAAILDFGTNSWAEYVERVTDLYARPSADGYETDSAYGSAKELVVDASAQAHTFSEPGDGDYLYVDLVAGTTYTIRTYASTWRRTRT
jgi:hypothetical protein